MADNTLKIKIETQGAESVSNSLKSIKQQIKDAKNEALQFEEGSEAFTTASQRAADLEKRLGAVNDEIALLRGDSLEKISNGFKGIGSAILSLDTGKLAQANKSLSSIPFKDIIRQAGLFGKELFKLATNPLFLIPTLISLIIANFDKLLKMFPILNVVVDAVKNTFDMLVDAIQDGINFAIDLYEKFSDVINVIFPIIGLVGKLASMFRKANEEEKKAQEEREANAKKREQALKSEKKAQDEKLYQQDLTIQKLKAEGKEVSKLELDYLKAQEAIVSSNLEKLNAISKLGGIYAQITEALIDEETKKLDKLQLQIIGKQKEINDKAKENAKKENAEEEKSLDDLLELANQILDASERARLAGIKYEEDIKNARIKSLDDLLELANEELDAEQAIRDQKKKAEESYTDMLEKENNKRLESEKRLQELKADAVLAGLTLISDLTTAFAGKNEAAARKAFNIQKGVSIASTTIETFLAAQLAYKSQFIPGVPDPTSPVRGAIAAGVAIAGGLGRVAKIAAQKFEGGGDRSAPAPTSSTSNLGSGSGAQTQQIIPPTFNLGGQQIGGASNILGSNNVVTGQQPIKVFVSETDISNVQNKVQVTEGNSLFGGPQ